MPAAIPRGFEEFHDFPDMITKLVYTARGLKRIRTERGLTLAEMGSLLGCSQSHLSRIEKGHRLPFSPGYASRQLGITAEVLLATCSRCNYSPGDGLRCSRCGSEDTMIDFTAGVAHAIMQPAVTADKETA